MILETTNPKYQQPPLIPAHAKRYVSTPDRGELEFTSQGTRNLAKGQAYTEQFEDRRPAPFVFDPKAGKHVQKPTPIPNHSREPEPRPQSSLWVTDEAHDAPLWLIIDRHTGHIFARVRGSLPWIVGQVQLAATQLGGHVNDLYYRRAPHEVI